MAHPASHPLAGFFGLVLLISLPFWLLGSLSGASLLPGLPLSALGAAAPGLAACLLVGAGQGRAALAALLRRLIRPPPRGARRWLALGLLLPLAVDLAALALQRRLGLPVPPPRPDPGRVLLLLAMFLPAAAAEELGWTAYALDPLRRRFGGRAAALVLGLAWAAWHLVPLLQAGRPPGWIAWWSLGTVAARVVLVWLVCRAGGNALVAVAFHAMGNTGWQLYPVQGSFYDRALTGTAMASLALACLAAGSGAGGRRS